MPRTTRPRRRPVRKSTSALGYPEHAVAQTRWGARHLISTQVTDPRPKSSPSVDGANEQEAYGVAVSLLVAGLRPDDLEQRLQSEGWSPEISSKVSRDLGKLGAGLGRHNKPEAPASKPSPDALNAMLAKRQPQVKKEAPDPLAAYLKMKKFGPRRSVKIEPYAIDARRLHLLMKWVVSFSILSRFGPRRGRRGASERTRSHETTSRRRCRHDRTRVHASRYPSTQASPRRASSRACRWTAAPSN